MYYQPFYCEENIWQLCQMPPLSESTCMVCVVTNRARYCPFWCQRLGGPPGDPVIWDYHVLLIRQARESWEAWDLDSRLPLPVPLPRYLQQTFPGLDRSPAPYIPRFRVVPAHTYVATLSSDRSHMRTAAGEYRQPPPRWPMILNARQEMNLPRFLDPDDSFVGRLLNLPEFSRRYAQGRVTLRT